MLPAVFVGYRDDGSPQNIGQDEVQELTTATLISPFNDPRIPELPCLLSERAPRYILDY